MTRLVLLPTLSLTLLSCLVRGEYIYKTQKKQMHTYLIIPTHLLHEVQFSAVPALV